MQYVPRVSLSRRCNGTKICNLSQGYGPFWPQKYAILGLTYGGASRGLTTWWNEHPGIIDELNLIPSVLLNSPVELCLAEVRGASDGSLKADLRVSFGSSISIQDELPPARCSSGVTAR